MFCNQNLVIPHADKRTLARSELFKLSSFERIDLFLIVLLDIYYRTWSEGFTAGSNSKTEFIAGDNTILSFQMDNDNFILRLSSRKANISSS